VIVASGLVLLLGTWVIVDRVVARPLRDVVRGAQRVADGQYGEPVAHSGADDEIQKVVESFNAMMLELGMLHERMQDRIGEALRRAHRTQESLVIAQRLAATGTLAAGIAHEVNNPLGGMLNAVRALRTKEMTAERRQEYLELVEDGLKRIEATVAKILRFTPHKVSPQAVDLADVVRPALALVGHRLEREGVEVDVVPPSEPAMVFGDFYELQQALLNVMINALDAIAEADRDDPRLRITVEHDDEEVVLRVADNGTGMDPEDVPRAFDLFFTTKEQGKGSGLGLATVHKILDDHGGRVVLTPHPGEGMEVAFVLPRLADAG
jgi:signal transduction histidine kinase